MITVQVYQKRKRSAVRAERFRMPYHKPNSVSAAKAAIDNHLSRPCVAAWLKRLSPNDVSRIGTRSCTDVRVLPLHLLHCCRSSPRCGLRCSGRLPPFGDRRHCSHLWVLPWQALPPDGLAASGSRIPNGVSRIGTSECYMLPYGSDRSFPQGRCSDFPPRCGLRRSGRLSGTAG